MTCFQFRFFKLSSFWRARSQSCFFGRVLRIKNWPICLLTAAFSAAVQGFLFPLILLKPLCFFKFFAWGIFFISSSKHHFWLQKRHSTSPIYFILQLISFLLPYGSQAFPISHLLLLHQHTNRCKKICSQMRTLLPSFHLPSLL